MTKREAAIIMAYTGVTMLNGDNWGIFAEYCEELLGFPLWTHEFPKFAETIKEKAKPDFIGLCASIESEGTDNGRT